LKVVEEMKMVKISAAALLRAMLAAASGGIPPSTTEYRRLTLYGTKDELAEICRSMEKPSGIMSVDKVSEEEWNEIHKKKA